MTDRHPTVALPGDRHAELNLPQSLQSDSPLRLEQGLDGTVAEPSDEPARNAADPGELEYESWMQQLRSLRP